MSGGRLRPRDRGLGGDSTSPNDWARATDARLRNLQAQGVSAAAITAAELRVLQFLPTRLTCQQMIGEHLFLFQTTVKTHAMSFYRKFWVSARAEAVAQPASRAPARQSPH